ncbi:hypothetical protein CN900_14490 [Bacillus anthracis]|nr:hypothetical protein CN900_14490 [Bacillus anthracis]PGP22908.1 hypothetical protein CN994_14685 [Bacillus anthracis]
MINIPYSKTIVSNGVEVITVKKRKFYEFQIMLFVNFGSLNNSFQIENGEKKILIPKGTAHFLEHTMFYMPGGEDIIKKFAKMGASINAFTTFETTSYLLSCTDRLYDNLELLIKLVSAPCFGHDIIKNEKGIIEQELRMYEDNARIRVFFNLLRGLYGDHHPISTPILGTIEDLKGIDKYILEQTYEAFYRPENIKILVIGDIDHKEIVNVIERQQINKKKKLNLTTGNYINKSCNEVVTSWIEDKMHISQPRIILGYKDKSLSLRGNELLRYEYSTKIGLEALIGNSSELFQELYQSGMINKGFSWSYEASSLYAYSTVGGECKNPEVILKEWNRAVQLLIENGLNYFDFQRAKAKIIGRLLELNDSLKKLCRNISGYLARGADFLNVITILQELTKEQVQRRIQEHLCSSRMCTSVVYPI